jgi:hypothetical protein
VRRWTILRGPLVIPVQKVGPLVNCLCVLHNFCININLDQNDENVGALMEKDVNHLHDTVLHVNTVKSVARGIKIKNEMVSFSTQGQPTDLIGGNNHFIGCPPNRKPTSSGTPMDEMLASIASQQLLRPLVA